MVRSRLWGMLVSFQENDFRLPVLHFGASRALAIEGLDCPAERPVPISAGTAMLRRDSIVTAEDGQVLSRAVLMQWK